MCYTCLLQFLLNTFASSIQAWLFTGALSRLPYSPMMLAQAIVHLTHVHEFPIWILTWTLTILAEVYRDFPQLLQCPPPRGERSASCAGCFTSGEGAPWYPLLRRLDGPQNRSGRREEEEILDPTGLELWPLGHPAHSYLLYRLSEYCLVFCAIYEVNLCHFKSVAYYFLF
jgi:hypothetical protein